MYEMRPGPCGVKAGKVRRLLLHSLSALLVIAAAAAFPADATILSPAAVEQRIPQAAAVSESTTKVTITTGGTTLADSAGVLTF